MTALREALAGPLAPLTALPRFLIYKVVPDPKRPGKTNKFPVDPATGAYVDAAAQGLTCEQALAALPDDGEHGVGFYFDEADGFWFLDVDGAWSPRRPAGRPVSRPWPGQSAPCRRTPPRGRR